MVNKGAQVKLHYTVFVRIVAVVTINFKPTCLSTASLFIVVHIIMCMLAIAHNINFVYVLHIYIEHTSHCTNNMTQMFTGVHMRLLFGGLLLGVRLLVE